MHLIEDLKNMWEDVSGKGEIRERISNSGKARERKLPRTVQGCHQKYGTVNSHVIVPAMVDATSKNYQSMEGNYWSATMGWAVECGSFSHISDEGRIFASSGGTQSYSAWA